MFKIFGRLFQKESDIKVEEGAYDEFEELYLVIDYMCSGAVSDEGLIKIYKEFSFSAGWFRQSGGVENLRKLNKSGFAEYQKNGSRIFPTLLAGHIKSLIQKVQGLIENPKQIQILVMPHLDKLRLGFYTCN
jgi:hypothetical protein